MEITDDLSEIVATQLLYQPHAYWLIHALNARDWKKTKDLNNVRAFHLRPLDELSGIVVDEILCREAFDLHSSAGEVGAFLEEYRAFLEDNLKDATECPAPEHPGNPQVLLGVHAARQSTLKRRAGSTDINAPFSRQVPLQMIPHDSRAVVTTAELLHAANKPFLGDAESVNRIAKSVVVGRE